VTFERHGAGGHHAASLVDILDRVLDKGLVVAGDIRISLANVELLTIRIRLLVCSIDKAEQIGLNWWRYDQSLVYPPSNNGRQDEMIERLEGRIAELEKQLQQRQIDAPAPTRRPARGRG
jgi:Gas vesicle protein